MSNFFWQKDEYSILRIIPVFIPNLARFFYRSIVLVGDVWLFATYLIFYTLRTIGRIVLLAPFFAVGLSIVIAFRVFALLKASFLLLPRFLSFTGDSFIYLVLLPRKLLTKKKKWDKFEGKDIYLTLLKLTGSVSDKKKSLLRWLNQPVKLRPDFNQNPLWLVYRHYRVITNTPRYRLQLVASAFGLCLFFGLAGLFYVDVVSDMPSPFKLKDIKLTASTRILDRNGRLLFNVYRNENRTPVKLSDLPANVLLATIAIEDKDFYRHKGVSFRGIVRAARANFLDHDNRIIQGGSTITQQLVKNLLLTPEKTVERKIKEIILALFMEVYYTKDEILQMYLNEVSYGGPNYGIEEAAQYYFGKSARFLTLAEAALLAGLPTQPSKNSPFIDPEAARVRQQIVLDRMVESGFIIKEKAEQAKNEKLVFVPKTIPIRAPHFVMMIREGLVNHFGRSVVEEGGLQVYTTLDLDIQTMAEKAVRENIARIGKAYRVGNGAALVTSPQTGEVLALVGSVDYFDTDVKGNVNIVTSSRQPGSSIKPINYAYAFENGWSPGSVIDDSPVVFRIPGSKPYVPVNYDNSFKGRMTLRMALAQSRNIPAVKLLNSYGEDAPLKMMDQGKKMGITTWNTPRRYGLALTLGSAEVTMLDMASVYGTIANLGVRRDPVLIRKVVKADGTVLVDNTQSKNFFSGLIRPAFAKEGVEGIWQKGKRVLSKTAAFWLISILSDNKARLPAFGPYAKLEIPSHTVAVKTGTTNDFRDNWTIGFTPDYLVATWVGNTDNTPMNSRLVSGITGAAPMWNDIMTNLISDLPDRIWAPPEEMVEIKICAINGLLTCANCPLTVTEYYKPGTEPKQACHFEAPDVCAAKKAQAEAEGKSPEEMKAILANCILPAASPTPNP